MGEGQTDQAAARRQLEAIGILRDLIDFDDFSQLRVWVVRGGVPMTAADEMRNELIGRRLSGITGLTSADLFEVNDCIAQRHITEEQARELLKILDSWPGDE